MAATRNTTAAGRYQLGDYYLAWRADRGEWAICWQDRASGFRRRTGTGIKHGGPDDPPVEAQKALAAHFHAAASPAPAKDNADARVLGILTAWLQQEGSKRARSAQYGYAVRHISSFLAGEKPGITVDDLTPDRTARYVAARRAQGISGETIHSELAALNRALNWAWRNRLIPSVPYIGKVEKEDRGGPRELEYSIEQVAALLEAAWRMPDRQHVHLFTLISLSTHGRTEAIMELTGDQVRGNRIYFNAPGRRQTTKRRSIVPIVPTLEPWIADRGGKIIRYRVQTSPKTWADADVPEYFERDTRSIRKSFAHCLIDAGICTTETDDAGEPFAVPIGSPNTLRHTLHTYLQTVGVPQAQIDAAAGHSSERGSGRNYTHLRPEYLKEFVEAVEAYWRGMDGLTKVHRRSQLGPKLANA